MNVARKLPLVTRIFVFTALIAGCALFFQETTIFQTFKTTMAPLNATVRVNSVKSQTTHYKIVLLDNATQAPTRNITTIRTAKKMELSDVSAKKHKEVAGNLKTEQFAIEAKQLSTILGTDHLIAFRQQIEYASKFQKVISHYIDKAGTLKTPPPLKVRENQCPAVSESLWSRNPHLKNPINLQCDLLISAAENGTENTVAQLFTEAANWTPLDPHTNTSIADLVQNCNRFLETVPFFTEPASKEEAEFPLAYVFMVHRNAAQTLRLFRMIYQPQNAYCIAYDTKSNEDYNRAMVSLAKCFPFNVYLIPNPEPIHYFGYSILHSAMECMKVLANSSIHWRYVQVVSWNDFPLKTNWEMVRIFKALNGSQDSELMQMNTPEHYVLQYGIPGGPRRSLAPGNLIVYKGSFANGLSREFVHFMLTDPTSQELYKWLQDAKGPEEFFWPTLVHNVQLNPPGGFPGECEHYYTPAGQKKPFLSRYQSWEWETSTRPCKGTYTNWSCVYGIRDLAMLLKRQELMAHKVYEEFEPAILRCLEEWYWKRTCMGNTGRDFQYYEKLPWVLYNKLSEEEKTKYTCV